MAVEWCLDTGWITIVGASSFNYNDSLTMEAFATVAVNGIIMN